MWHPHTRGVWEHVPPENFEKLDPLRLNLRVFLAKGYSIGDTISQESSLALQALYNNYHDNVVIAAAELIAN